MMKRARTVMGSVVVAAFISLVPTAGAMADTYWQCVPFARLASGIQIFGDAWTWWRQAAGRYATGATPKAGAVLCFKPQGKMRLGHVAVVSQVITERVIQISHANWSRIGGTRGQIEKDVTVIDVSPAGDWTQVKVWYDPVRDLGGTVYPTHGFIYQDAASQQLANSGAATAENTAIAMAQTAANQVASVVRPGANPLQMLGQAADSTDKTTGRINPPAE
jgi:surface antigen